MTGSPRFVRWRPRYLSYGPIADIPPEDRSEIAYLIQRGRAVTNDRLATQALAYARFRRRVFGVLGSMYLVLAAGEAGTAAFASVGLRIVDAGFSGVWLLLSLGWLYQADCCRRGAQATAQACAERQ